MSGVGDINFERWCNCCSCGAISRPPRASIHPFAAACMERAHYRAPWMKEVNKQTIEPPPTHRLSFGTNFYIFHGYFVFPPQTISLWRACGVRTSHVHQRGRLLEKKIRCTLQRGPRVKNWHTHAIQLRACFFVVPLRSQVELPAEQSVLSTPLREDRSSIRTAK